jgi:hypothetical protein
MCGLHFLFLCFSTFSIAAATADAAVHKKEGLVVHFFVHSCYSAELLPQNCYFWMEM